MTIDTLEDSGSGFKSADKGDSGRTGEDNATIDFDGRRTGALEVPDLAVEKEPARHSLVVRETSTGLGKNRLRPEMAVGEIDPLLR